MKYAALCLSVLTLTATTATLSAATAKENYEAQCAKCHGADGKGQTLIGKKNGAKDWTDAKVQETLKDEKLAKAIKEGVTDDGGKSRMTCAPDGTASAPADYAPLGASATIPAGATYVDLPVIPTVNLAPRPTQTVKLTMIGATNGAIVSPGSASVTISDGNTNPLPVVWVSSTNQPYAIEGGGPGAFVFQRNGDTTSALTVACVPTGMKTGVSTSPWSVASRPRRAAVVASFPSN